MAIEGSLGTLPFADLLQILGSTRKTGTLVFHRGKAWKKLYLRDGVIVATASSEQVRQPLNRKGVGSAEPYRQWLGPLIEELGPLAS